MRKRLLFYLLAATLVASAKAQVKTDPAVMKDFMDQRFGMFIHWGPVTLRGTEIGWSRGKEVVVGDYDSLYHEFDPVLFDADKIVTIARDAGMKYLTIVAKHHDGFCLWPTAYTAYNIMNTPYKKDVIGALARSCKKQGIKFCIYYSVLDWHHPDYPNHLPGDANPDPKADIQRYITYMKNQLRELVTGYDPYMLWFDGYWEKAWTEGMGKDIYAYLKQLKPGLIVNDRLGKFGDAYEMVGDYKTPEQTVGSMNMTIPWESCFTICTQWAWKPNDKMKSLEECLRILCSTAGGNGNLLLNLGPMPDGRIEARQAARLHDIGLWLKTNGAAIYGTLGGPYPPSKAFATTRKGKNIYLLVTKPDTTTITLESIPGVDIVRAHTMDGAPIKINHKAFGFEVQLPRALSGGLPYVIVLETDKATEALPLASSREERTSAAAQVQRYGMITGIKPDKIAFYKQLHAAAWPEVLQKIRDCHIRNYSIYLKQIDSSYYLFSYFEYTGSDFSADMLKMAADSTTQQWWKLTDPTQLPLPDAAGKGQIWSGMEEVFHTD